MACLYVMFEANHPEGPIKAGMSTVSAASRRDNLQAGNHRLLVVDYEVKLLPNEAPMLRDIERRLKSWLDHYIDTSGLRKLDTEGEWFQVSTTVARHAIDCVLNRLRNPHTAAEEAEIMKATFFRDTGPRVSSPHHLSRAAVRAWETRRKQSAR